MEQRKFGGRQGDQDDQCQMCQLRRLHQQLRQLNVCQGYQDQDIGCEDGTEQQIKYMKFQDVCFYARKLVVDILFRFE